jgi:hypothetical protein
MNTMDSDTTQIFVRGDNNLIHDYDHVKFCPFRSKKISIIEGLDTPFRSRPSKYKFCMLILVSCG